jgi:hypothetical protein
MWAYITSAGPVFFVRAAHGLGTTAPSVRLLGGRELPLASSASAAEQAVAGWGPDERLYLWLEGLGGPAICLREAHQALVARLEERAGGLVLVCGPDDAASPKAGATAVSGHAADDLTIAVARLEAIPAPNAERPS